jgi:hypothetical protein
VPESSSIADLQFRFTRHIRNPDLEPAPAGVPEARIGVYRELIYNNIEGLLADNFPVIRKITADDAWEAMVRDYLVRHRSHTPLFPWVPLEFLDYLQNEREAAQDPAFLLELAHYEWVETEVGIDEQELDLSDVDLEGDLLAGVPVLNPIIQPLSYHFPVHRISPDFLPKEQPQEATYLLVYRDREYKVGFMELNAVSARLVQRLLEDPEASGAKLLAGIAAELNHPNPQAVIDGGLITLQHMRGRDIVLGTRR